jgi:hypothetical protein
MIVRFSAARSTLYDIQCQDVSKATKRINVQKSDFNVFILFEDVTVLSFAKKKKILVTFSWSNYEWPEFVAL